MAISKQTRFGVFKRDGFRCMYCGRRPPDVMLEVDHVHPKSQGGTDESSNLTTSCFACNRGKGAVTLGDAAPVVDEATLLAGIQETLERAALLRKTSDAEIELRHAEDAAIGQVLDWWDERISYNSNVEEASIRRFLKQLTADDLIRAINQCEDAIGSRRVPAYQAWKYFCGICWAWIRERAAVA